MEKKSYDCNNNPVYRKVGTKLTNKWRKESHIESFKKHGNGWWWYIDCPQDNNRRKYWINKFRKEGV